MKQVKTILPVGGELKDCGTGEAITLPGVAPDCVGVIVGKPVGSTLGVTNGNNGVAVKAGSGVTVVVPPNIGSVGVAPGRGGFCQM